MVLNIHGLVEMANNDCEWRSICDDYWTDEDANVVCQQLNLFPHGKFCIQEQTLYATARPWSSVPSIIACAAYSRMNTVCVLAVRVTYISLCVCISVFICVSVGIVASLTSLSDASGLRKGTTA